MDVQFFWMRTAPANNHLLDSRSIRYMYHSHLLLSAISCTFIMLSGLPVICRLFPIPLL